MSTKAIVLGALFVGGLSAVRAGAADPPVAAPMMQPTEPVVTGTPATNPAAPVIVPGTQPIIVPGVATAPAQPTAPPQSDVPIPAITEQPGLPAGSVCSPWSGPGGTGCCGPIGKHGPIQTELFLRNGVSLPVAGGIFNNSVAPAYVFSAGARSLFFNPAGSAAWTIEYGFDYFHNNGNHPNLVYDVFGTFVDIRELHRAAVHLSVGRNWFMYTPAYQVGTNYRFGYDAGGRYGYGRVNFNLPDSPNQRDEPPNLTRRGDVFGAVLVGLSAEMEIPMTACTTFIGGVRGEWAYNFTDIIPTWDSDLQEVLIMFSFGVRF